MKELSEYKIAFTGLSLGTHEYEFEVTDKFFSHFDHEELTNVQVELVVELEKKTTMLQLWFGFQGTGTVICDRCGEEMEIELDGEEELIVKFGDGSYVEQTDEIITIPPSEHEIDISHYVFEFIMLSVPQAHSHEEKDCNPEVIKKTEAALIPDNEKLEAKEAEKALAEKPEV